MNEEPDKSSANGTSRTEATPVKSTKRRIRPWVIGVVLVVFAGLGVTTAVLFWPKPAGKPVPAPRNVSFEQPDTTQNTGEQRLVLAPEHLRSAKLQIEAIGERTSSAAAAALATGVVQANTYKETPLMSLVGGIVRSVKAELGQNIRQGQTVAVVFSNELADTQSTYVSSIAALDEHHRHHLRTMKLVEIGAASREELDRANSEYREAESRVANLKQKLLLLGMSTQKIAALKSVSEISSEVSLPSPSSGTVTSRTVNPGEVIEANKELMRITDLSTVWVVGQVYEKDLATVRVGTPADVTSDAYPDRVFRGRVSYVDPKIDPATRTAQTRIELTNPRQILKIGMYVKIAFAGTTVTGTDSAVVPKAAVQSIVNQTYVFLPAEKQNEFTMRLVRLGPETNGFYPVIEGLSVGDRVVTEGSFLLRAEYLKQHPIQ